MIDRFLQSQQTESKKTKRPRNTHAVVPGALMKTGTTKQRPATYSAGKIGLGRKAHVRWFAACCWVIVAMSGTSTATSAVSTAPQQQHPVAAVARRLFPPQSWERRYNAQMVRDVAFTTTPVVESFGEDCLFSLLYCCALICWAGEAAEYPCFCARRFAFCLRCGSRRPPCTRGLCVCSYYCCVVLAVMMLNGQDGEKSRCGAGAYSRDRHRERARPCVGSHDSMVRLFSAPPPRLDTRIGNRRRDLSLGRGHFSEMVVRHEPRDKSRGSVLRYR